MSSLWLDRSPSIETDARSRPDFDEIIVGAGITGLITAVLLARAGRRVAVLEARTVGAVATGNTTAKLSVLQGAHLQKINARCTDGTMHAYVRANLAGRRWVLDFAEGHGVAVQRRDAVSFASTPDGAASVEEEYRLASTAGLAVALEADAGLPFPTFGAVRLADQAEFDPMQLLAALADEVRSLGGVIREGVRVTGANARQPVRVHTDRGEFSAERLVLATGTPMLDRGLYFAKLAAKRSYAASYRVPGSLPRDMYLSVDEPSRSIRTTPDGDGELLLVGGYGHAVGREPSPASRRDELFAWTESTWPGAERTHDWSAQDYETPHGVPFVGWLPRSGGRIFLATGYDKWGMTNAAQCAMTLAGDLLGGTPEWAAVLHHRVTLPAAIGRGIGMNAAVAKHYAVGWTSALVHRLPDAPPPEGAGAVGRVGIAPVAASTVDGRTCRVTGICPHLGAILTWNDAEASWDCPAHGSRFAASGERLEGPATRDLRRR